MSKNQVTFLLILLLWGLSGSAFAQSSPTDLLDQGIQLYENGAYDKAIPLLESACKQSESLLTQKDQANAFYHLAQSYLYTGQLIEATTSYVHANKIAKAINYHDILSSTAEALGEIYTFRGEHRKSIDILSPLINESMLEENVSATTTAMTKTGINFLRLGILDSAQYFIEEGLRIKLEKKDSFNLELHYNHLGNFYLTTIDLNQSIFYFLKTLKIFEHNNNRPQIVIALNNIASIFYSQKNLKRAEEYAERAANIAREENLNLGLALSSHTLGDIKRRQGNIDQSLEHYEEAINSYRSSTTHKVDYYILTKKANIYLNKGAFEIAEASLFEALKIANEKEEKKGIVDINLELVNFKLKVNKNEEAFLFLKKARNILKTYDRIYSRIDFHEMEVQYYQQTNQHEEGLQAFRQLELLQKKSYEAEQSDQVHELEERYERAKKDKKITALNATKKIKDFDLQQSRRNYIIGSIGLILATLLGFLLYYINRTKRQSNKKLVEKNEIISKSLLEKETLLREIHHRVKNNLQVVSSLLRLQSRYIKSEKALDAIQEGRNRVKSMSLIHQDLYQADNLTGIEAVTYIERLSNYLFHSYNIDSERIQLTTDIDNLNIDVDTIIPLGLILNELLTNALKYAFLPEQKGVVKIELKEKDNHLFLLVEDDGENINLKEKKSGIDGGFGMKLVEAFAEKINAKINVFHNNGTTIQLSIKDYKLV